VSRKLGFARWTPFCWRLDCRAYHQFQKDSFKIPWNSRWDSSFVWLFFIQEGSVKHFLSIPSLSCSILLSCTLRFNQMFSPPRKGSLVPSCSETWFHLQNWTINIYLLSIYGLKIFVRVLGYLPLLCVTWEYFFGKPGSWVFGENSSCVCVVSSRTIIGSTEVFSASESQWIPVIWKEIVWTISALLGLVGAQSNPQQITRTPIDPSWGLDMLWNSI